MQKTKDSSVIFMRILMLAEAFVDFCISICIKAFVSTKNGDISLNDYLKLIKQQSKI